MVDEPTGIRPQIKYCLVLSELHRGLTSERRKSASPEQVLSPSSKSVKPWSACWFTTWKILIMFLLLGSSSAFDVEKDERL